MDKPIFEKGKPLPKRNQNRCKYRWLAEMQVGDSFVCPQENVQVIRQLSYLKRKKTAANWLPDGFKIASQKIDDSFYRVWRVA